MASLPVPVFYGQRNPPMSLEERFMARTERDPNTGCLNWIGHVMRGGYGTFCGEGRRSWLAHRWSYTQFVGPIPKGFQVDHLCRNRRCVEPTHLEAVTPAENNRRSESPSAKNLSKTHCQNGHEFTPENTYSHNAGVRECRTCTLQRNALWRAQTASATPTTIRTTRFMCTACGKFIARTAIHERGWDCSRCGTVVADHEPRLVTVGLPYQRANR